MPFLNFAFLFILFTTTLISCERENVSNQDASYEGIYIGDVQQTGMPATVKWNISVSKSSGSDFNIIVQGILSLKGSISNNNLNIPKQIVSGSGSSRVEWYGTGKFSGNKLEINFLQDIGGVYAATYSGTLLK